MPPSKTAPLEKRIEKLERELAAYKRQLSKAAPGENASARQLAVLRELVTSFFRAADDHGVRFWVFHPEVANAADWLRAAITLPTAPKPPIPRKPST
jgi:N-acyl-D-aspartate/D-glutamate deacylase